MDELSDYFRQYPFENPANYVGTHYDPEGAAIYRARSHVWRLRRGCADAPWACRSFGSMDERFSGSATADGRRQTADGGQGGEFRDFFPLKGS
ncbi:MAG: hypothetical protein JWQ03_2212 [Variovorax sp.]|nr:hypothetical protein [Variovorax sp.]